MRSIWRDVRHAAAVQATLYYQATPPFLLSGRFCTSRARTPSGSTSWPAHLNLDGTEAEDWKLEVVSTAGGVLGGDPPSSSSVGWNRQTPTTPGPTLAPTTGPTSVWISSATWN